MLSGIQHFYYSKRQWCLIHLEQQWSENKYTIEGRLLHEIADNPNKKEKRTDIIISRAMPVSSKHLGLSGVLDVVEFIRDNNDGVPLKNRSGLWRPQIVEYKRGKPKTDLRDIVQLVAQVICLEEMFNTWIPISYIYYGQIKHRVEIEITSELKTLVKKMADEMHDIYQQQKNVGLLNDPADQGDSLKDISLSHVLKPNFNAEDWMFKNIDHEVNP